MPFQSAFSDMRAMGRSAFNLSNATRPWYSKLKEFNTSKSSSAKSCDSPVEFGRNLKAATARVHVSTTLEDHSFNTFHIVSETAEQSEAKCKSEEKCKFSPTHKAITVCPIETRLSNGEELWDHDFSSMSSYRSDDLDIVFGTFNSVKQVDCLPQQGAASSDNDNGGASCSRSETDEEWTSCQVETDHGRLKREYTKLRRERNRESLSAALPSDLVGAAAANSIALVKQSYDPYEDFRESITEMISDNKEIYKGPELEELLYCYISLNSAEHHDLIRLVFVEVLIDLHHGRV